MVKQAILTLIQTKVLSDKIMRIMNGNRLVSCLVVSRLMSCLVVSRLVMLYHCEVVRRKQKKVNR